MNKKNQRGFTLIELLVVIAIIGILAALVLVALGNARDKANDAAIKSDMGQLRTLAEVFYDSNQSSYDRSGESPAGPDWATCISSPDGNCATAEIASSVTSLTADISSKNGGTAITAASSPSEFCMVATLKTGNEICVDATGEFEESDGVSCGSTPGSIVCS